MDECKSMGLEVKGPDINESFSSFSVSEPGVIRFGLSAIKGIGPDVVRTIIETRDTGGPYKDIYDFVERVPSQQMNRRVFDNLVLAGAFDCFQGIKREDLSAEVDFVYWTVQLVCLMQRLVLSRSQRMYGARRTLITYQEWHLSTRWIFLERTSITR